MRYAASYLLAPVAALLWLVGGSACLSAASEDREGPRAVPLSAAAEASINARVSENEEVPMTAERAALPECFRSTGAEATRSKSGTLVVTLGSGSRGAVFAPISWEDACQW